MQKQNIGVVILIYKSCDFAIKVVKQFLELPGNNIMHIAIVDNTVDDSCSEQSCCSLNCKIFHPDDILSANSKKSQVFYIPMKDNVGYAKGNNAGARFLLKNFQDTDFLLFSNDDIILEDQNILITLCETLTSYPDIGCIGPQVVGIDGYQQSPRNYDDPSVFQIIGRLLCPVCTIIRQYFPKKQIFKNKKSVYPAGKYSWLIGAFMLFPADIFLKIEMFDEGTFLYGEENIIGAKLKSIGKTFYFEPKTMVRHLRQASSAHLNNTIEKSDMRFQSCLRYYTICKKHSAFTLQLLQFSYFVYKKFWRQLF